MYCTQLVLYKKFSQPRAFFGLIYSHELLILTVTGLATQPHNSYLSYQVSVPSLPLAPTPAPAAPLYQISIRQAAT
jgi:hypothetical protein